MFVWFCHLLFYIGIISIWRLQSSGPKGPKSPWRLRPKAAKVIDLALNVRSPPVTPLLLVLAYTSLQMLSRHFVFCLFDWVPFTFPAIQKFSLSWAQPTTRKRKPSSINQSRHFENVISVLLPPQGPLRAVAYRRGLGGRSPHCSAESLHNAAGDDIRCI